MERATKLFVIGWACAALCVQLWLLRGAWPWMAPLAAGFFAVAAVSTAIDRRAIAAVLAFAYIFPALIKLLHGQYHIYFGVLWMAALLGAIVPDAVRSSWHVPARWRAAVGCWALVVIAGSMVVIWREMDFYPGLIFAEHAAGPLFAAQWILHLSLSAVAGILWFDWLFGASDLDRRTWVARPLAASCAVLSLVAIYQATVDVGFLNETVYGVLKRASGTVFDGNVCGTLAAFWVGGAMMLTSDRGRFSRAITAGAMVLSWMAVWATGSRTGFVAAALITGFCFVGLVRTRVGPWPRLTPVYAFAALTVTIGAVIVAANLHLAVTGPIPRLLGMLPGRSYESFAAFASELWNRNRYGEMATTLIRRYPWFGIGIGSFHTYGPDIAMITAGIVLEPDNAQNWYRHQLVEFGLVGSLAWLTWVLAFGKSVLTVKRDEPASRWAVRGSLIALGFVSLFGMPAQDLTVVITFWTFAFWYVWLAPAEARARPVRAAAWVSAVAVAAIFAVGTYHVGVTHLRPPFRARDRGLPYSYGFNAVEADGAGGEQRWARQRAVAVVQAPKRWLKLQVSVNHVDLAADPVHAQVWADGSLVVDARLSTPEPVVRYVAVPMGSKWVAIRSAVNRVLRPSDFGVADARELGLLLKWDFVDAPG